MKMCQMQMTLALILLICSINSLKIKNQDEDCFQTTLYVVSESTITSFKINEEEQKEFKSPKALEVYEYKTDLNYLDEITITVTESDPKLKGVAVAILTQGNVLVKLNEFDWTCGNKKPEFKDPTITNSNFVNTRLVWEASTTNISICKFVFDPVPRQTQTFNFIVDDSHEFFRLNGFSIPFTGINNWTATRTTRINFKEGDTFEITGANGNLNQLPSSSYNVIGKDLMSIHAVLNYNDRNGNQKRIITNEDWKCGEQPAQVLSPGLSLFGGNAESVGIFLGVAKGIWEINNPVKTICNFTTLKPRLLKFDFFSDASIISIRINGTFIKTKTIHSQEREHIVPVDRLYAYPNDTFEIEALNDHVVRNPGIYGGLTTSVKKQKTSYMTNNDTWKCNDNSAIEYKEKSSEFCTSCLVGSKAKWIWDSKNSQRVKCTFKFPNN